MQIEWPEQLLLDYFQWGHLKSEFYMNRSNNLDDLKLGFVEIIEMKLSAWEQLTEHYKVTECL